MGIVQAALLCNADIHTEAVGQLGRSFVKRSLYHRLGQLCFFQRQHLQVFALTVSIHVPEHQTVGRINKIREEITFPVSAPDEIVSHNGMAGLGQGTLGDERSI